jgi:hypothetical protein
MKSGLIIDVKPCVSSKDIRQCTAAELKASSSRPQALDHKLLGTISWLPALGYKLLATSSWPQALGYQLLATSSWLPALGYKHEQLFVSVVRCAPVWCTLSCRMTTEAMCRGELLYRRAYTQRCMCTWRYHGYLSRSCEYLVCTYIQKSSSICFSTRTLCTRARNCVHTYQHTRIHAYS